jgi:hypothetical protein
MQVQINTKKDYYGKWVAKSRVALQGKQVLEVTTMKSDSGYLQTLASVVEVEESGTPGISITRFVMFQDFNVRVEISKPRVCTEKVVRAQQELALTRIEEIKANAIAFYQEKAVAA